MNESIPANFSGLLYPPDKEPGVYLAMGLLWKHLPYQFAIEEFEVNPRKQGYSHNKTLDAKGKQFVDGKWRDVTFEFKLVSSDFTKDIQHHSALNVDFLVCWENDSAGIASYVGQVIALRSIFEKLPEDERRKIILYPSKVHGVYPIPSKALGTFQSELTKNLGNFSQENRKKVERLIEKCPWVQLGETEIKWIYGNKTLFRASPYKLQYLLARKSLPKEMWSIFEKSFGGIENTEGFKIPLNRLDMKAIDEIAELLIKGKKILGGG